MTFLIGGAGNRQVDRQTDELCQSEDNLKQLDSMR